MTTTPVTTIRALLESEMRRTQADYDAYRKNPMLEECQDNHRRHGEYSAALEWVLDADRFLEAIFEKFIIKEWYT